MTKTFCDRCEKEMSKKEPKAFIAYGDEYYVLCPSCFQKVKDVLTKHDSNT